MIYVCSLRRKLLIGSRGGMSEIRGCHGGWGNMSAGFQPSEIGGDIDCDAISLIEMRIPIFESPRFT